MKVANLVPSVTASMMQEKAAISEKILRKKLCELDRAKRLVAAMEMDLAEFMDMEIESIETSNYRY